MTSKARAWMCGWCAHRDGVLWVDAVKEAEALYPEESTNNRRNIGGNSMNPCYHNRFHPSEKPCPNEGIWRGKKLGNPTDTWTWCDEHKPPNVVPAEEVKKP